LFWVSSYVASHFLAVASQSGANEKNYFTVYYITLNLNCEAQREILKIKNNVEDRVISQN
jgi:hypothetical protein